MAKKIMMVEGDDDEHVVKGIFGQHAIPHLDDVENLGGIDPLLKTIGVRLMSASEEGDVVGVVMDADENVAGRWQGLRHIFRESGYLDVPNQPVSDGTILFPPTGSVLPRAGVWIMPDNQTDGKLEDFLRLLVPKPNDLFNHAVASVDSVPERLFSDNNRIKAVMHTWLAWQEKPGKPYGQAITAQFLDPQADHAVAFASWIRRLFFG